jgi:diguanylate cyclase (GGDEF) domain
MTWIFIAIGMSYFLLNDLVFHVGQADGSKKIVINTGWKLSISFSFIILHIVKTKLFDKNMLEKPNFYYADRLIWLLNVSVSIIFINTGIWSYVMILFVIMMTSLTRGRNAGFILVACSLVIHVTLYYVAYSINLVGIGVYGKNLIENFTVLLFLYIMYALFASLCGRIYKDSVKYDKENRYLVDQLEEKCLQLETAQQEIKCQYDKLKGNNEKLEEMNKRLSVSIAEFYTLQQISKAVSSILDIGELLKYLNDIIIGVMGVSYSTIILFDENTHKLKVNTSNIVNLNEMAILTDNINNSLLKDAIYNGLCIIENAVDTDKYPFTKNREINSLICLPLSTKSRKFGLVLIEHKYTNAFDDDNARLLGIISQQVGIAMENAELYHSMHELAIRDGLTGMYNRQYFQERLDSEFENARAGKYPISLAIFDIDHFKRFNDTFGHLFGDKVLKSITETVSASLRKSDILARFGGEEFIVLFPRTNLKDAYEKAESLRKIIASHIITDKLVTATITVSFGVSCYDECALTENELIRTADDSLYEAKMAGRNCIKVAKKLE